MGFKNSTSKKLNRSKTKIFDEIHGLYVIFKRIGFHRFLFIDEIHLFLTLFNINALNRLFKRLIFTFFDPKRDLHEDIQTTWSLHLRMAVSKTVQGIPFRERFGFGHWSMHPHRHPLLYSTEEYLGMGILILIRTKTSILAYHKKVYGMECFKGPIKGSM